MSTFSTPPPVLLVLELASGDARVVASDRPDTVVEVRPRDPSRAGDVKAAAQTRVLHENGHVVVKAPKRWSAFDGGSVDVLVELPTASTLTGSVASGDVRCEGRFGTCRFKLASGRAHIGHAGTVKLSSASGDITVDEVSGDADVSTASGDVRIGRVTGAASVKTSNGDAWLGEVGGDARLVTANGGIIVGRAGASVDARTAHGDIRLGEVARGSVSLGTAFGRIDIGIRAGTAARLDLRSGAGRVLNLLEPCDGPGDADATVEIRGRTGLGDVTVRRAELRGDDPSVTLEKSL